eukprot:2882302-Amphidinium_carterae.2
MDFKSFGSTFDKARNNLPCLDGGGWLAQPEANLHARLWTVWHSEAWSISQQFRRYISSSRGENQFNGCGAVCSEPLKERLVLTCKHAHANMSDVRACMPML